MKREEGWEDDREMIFFSQDVKALYPCIVAEEGVIIIEKRLLETEIEYEGIDYKEIEKHLAVELSKELRLEEVLPRKTKGGTGKVTMAYLETEVHQDKTEKWTWEGQREPTDMEKRKMLARLVRKLVVVVMKNHLYQFEGKLYLQLEGGPIGLLLTGTISRVVMLEWDRLFLMKLTELDLSPEMYFRYVDDHGVSVWSTPKGMKYKEGKLVMEEEDMEEGMKKENCRAVQRDCEHDHADDTTTGGIPEQVQRKESPSVGLGGVDGRKFHHA
jgi:hypothetical protein